MENTMDKKGKNYGKVGAFFLILGPILQVMVIVLPWIIYYYTGNWGFIILAFGVQMLIMPILMLICGLGGLISSILAYQRIGMKKRYIVMIVLSSIITAFGGVLALTTIRGYF